MFRLASVKEAHMCDEDWMSANDSYCNVLVWCKNGGEDEKGIHLSQITYTNPDRHIHRLMISTASTWYIKQTWTRNRAYKIINTTISGNAAQLRIICVDWIPVTAIAADGTEVLAKLTVKMPTMVGTAATVAVAVAAASAPTYSIYLTHSLVWMYVEQRQHMYVQCTL